MKITKNMTTLLIAVTMMSAVACTDEFKYTIPPKYPANPDVEDVDYDVTFDALLDEMISYEEAAKFPAVVYTAHQTSSYDRRSATPGTAEWFANDDGWGYVRKEINEGRSETVIMDHRGPGVITRIWLTSLTDKNAVVRFYFNGGKTPDWTVSSLDLQQFDSPLRQQGGSKPLGMGFVQPEVAWNRGSNLWLPIPYASGCKITFEEQSTAHNPSRYYHINYRAYPEDTSVETFSTKVFNNSRDKVSDVNLTLIDPKARVSGRVLTAEDGLAQSEILKLDLTPGKNAVTELRIEVTGAGNNYEAVMDGLIFIAKFDGAVTAGLPLSELCAAGPGSPSVSNYYMTADGNGSIVLRWIMPYESTGTLAVRNDSPHPANVKITARAGSFARDDRTLYFHAAAKSEKNVRIIYWSDYGNGYDWNFAAIQGGRGVFRGDMYSINNHTNNWPGEGDEKIWVDDETFPSHFGTGVEDYYSFCGVFRYRYPFVGETRLDAATFNGVNTHNRMRSLDGIPFTNKLKFDLEMEGHEAGTADIRNAVFWYGDLSAKAVGMKEYTFD